jgi:uracil-DNA glycosylase family protein
MSCGADVTVKTVEKNQPDKVSARQFLPTKHTLENLRRAAQTCKGCDLYKNATQTVFGEGPKEAEVIFVGEQPGDMEDRQGQPFVGPAGRMFDRALAEAKLSRPQVYVTNAVKHFKWTPQGKRRKHQKPLMSEIMACKPWLSAELEVLRPKILVCMGATAAQSVLGKNVLITRDRGKFIEAESGLATLITIHPSAIYRHRDKGEQEQEYRRFAAEIKLVKRKLQSLAA